MWPMILNMSSFILCSIAVSVSLVAETIVQKNNNKLDIYDPVTGEVIDSKVGSQ